MIAVRLVTDDDEFEVELKCLPRINDNFNLYVDEEKDGDFTRFKVREIKHYFCDSDGHEIFIELDKLKQHEA